MAYLENKSVSSEPRRKKTRVDDELKNCERIRDVDSEVGLFAAAMLGIVLNEDTKTDQEQILYSLFLLSERVPIMYRPVHHKITTLSPL